MVKEFPAFETLAQIAKADGATHLSSYKLAAEHKRLDLITVYGPGWGARLHQKKGQFFVSKHYKTTHCFGVEL